MINSKTNRKLSSEEEYAVIYNFSKGKYGLGEKAKKKLEEEGYDYQEIKDLAALQIIRTFFFKKRVYVSRFVLPAKPSSFSEAKIGQYETKSDYVWFKIKPDNTFRNTVIRQLDKGEKVFCDGRYTQTDDEHWLYVNVKGKWGYIKSTDLVRELTK